MSKALYEIYVWNQSVDLWTTGGRWFSVAPSKGKVKMKADSDFMETVISNTKSHEDSVCRLVAFSLNPSRFCLCLGACIFFPLRQDYFSLNPPGHLWHRAVAWADQLSHCWERAKCIFHPSASQESSGVTGQLLSGVPLGCYGDGSHKQPRDLKQDTGQRSCCRVRNIVTRDLRGRV